MSVGQYKTESELRDEIKRLEQIGNRGELTLPQARELSQARRELNQIERAKNPRSW